MKKCSYCGAEYSDDTIICPVDKTSLDSPPWSGELERSKIIGPAGYWLIFAGVPMAIIAVLMAFTMHDGDIRGVSERALPYVLLSVPLAIIVGCRELYHHVPKHLVIPFGVVGWIVVAILVMCRFW
jgi:hypothetical protein